MCGGPGNLMESGLVFPHHKKAICKHWRLFLIIKKKHCSDKAQVLLPGEKSKYHPASITVRGRKNNARTEREQSQIPHLRSRFRRPYLQVTHTRCQRSVCALAEFKTNTSKSQKTFLLCLERSSNAALMSVSSRPPVGNPRVLQTTRLCCQRAEGKGIFIIFY